MTCPKCGGEIIGDGYTSVERCENAKEDGDWQYAAPDEGPFLCDFEEGFKCKGQECNFYVTLTDTVMCVTGYCGHKKYNGTCPIPDALEDQIQAFGEGRLIKCLGN